MSKAFKSMKIIPLRRHLSILTHQIDSCLINHFHSDSGKIKMIKKFFVNNFGYSRDNRYCPVHAITSQKDDITVMNVPP